MSENFSEDEVIEERYFVYGFEISKDLIVIPDKLDKELTIQVYLNEDKGINLVVFPDGTYKITEETLEG